MAGPGGYTRPLGGVVNVKDLRSLEIVASMKTSRALEWNAWLEKPRSIRETVIKTSIYVLVQAACGIPWMFEALRFEGMVIGTVNFLPNANLDGMLSIVGRSTNMNGGSSVSTLSSLGNLIPGPGRVKLGLGLLPAMRKLPWGVSVTLE